MLSTSNNLKPAEQQLKSLPNVDCIFGLSRTYKRWYLLWKWVETPYESLMSIIPDSFFLYEALKRCVGQTPMEMQSDVREHFEKCGFVLSMEETDNRQKYYCLYESLVIADFRTYYDKIDVKAKPETLEGTFQVEIDMENEDEMSVQLSFKGGNHPTEKVLEHYLYADPITMHWIKFLPN